MVTINAQQALSQISLLLARVEDTGESYLICRDGKPVATLARAQQAQAPDPLAPHPELAGKILYDPTEPASEEDWATSAR